MPFSDPVRELLDLIAVHGFYISVLKKTLGHEIPLPKEATNPDKERAEQSIDILRRWLAVLDLAIAPIVVRDALKDALPRETSEALMRYFIEKASHTEGDRDKTDCIATALYRSSPEGNKSAPDTADRYHFIAQMANAFEVIITSTLGDNGIPEIKDEHRQLLREFEFLHQEVDDFRTFDQLMDSGIVQRVRDIKQSFSDSFYNPKVLANVAVYNSTFGKRFDELFRAAAVQIKSFAVAVQTEGASIMSRVDGDITVKHLADVEDQKIMTQEYGKAQENFRQISKFKKVVDKNDKSRGARRGPVAIPTPAPIGGYQPVQTAPPPPPTGIAARHAQAATKQAEEVTSMNSMPAQAQNSIEDGKIRLQLDAMRTFVRVADKSCFVVPLVKGVINITAAEAEALRAEFGAEKSFRSDYANTVCHMLALMARLVVEQEEFRAKQKSAYLWKPHADAITYIMQMSAGVIESASQIAGLAEGRGLADKSTAMKATITKFRAALLTATGTLRTVGEASAAAPA